MKTPATKGFFSARFSVSSPVTYSSSIFFSHTSLFHLSFFRLFRPKSVPNHSDKTKKLGLGNINGLDTALSLFESMSETKKLGLGNIKGSDDENALSLFESMSATKPLPSVIQFTQLLSRVVKLKEYSSAISIFKGICDLGVPVNEYTMTIAINCFCLSGRVDYGFSILGWFFKRGCAPNVFTYSTLLKGLFRENKINEAQELFRKMVREELCELSVVTYGTVINGLCKAGNTAMAIQLFRDMEKGGSTCKPNAHIYNMLIDGLCKDGMIDSALNLYDEMSDKDIPPDVVTYSALIHGLCSLGRWKEFKVLVKRMIDYKIYPDVVTFSTLVDALCKQGKTDDAEYVIHIMKQQNVIPGVVTYNSLLDGYCLQGRMDKARNVFDSMAVGLKPNFYTYCNMLDGLCKNGQVEQAASLLDELERKREGHLCINYYSIVMDGFVESKKLDAARDIFKNLPSKGCEPDVVSCNILIKGCCQNGLLEEARAMFTDLPSKGFEPNLVTYTTLITGYCQNGQLEEANNLFLSMKQASLSPNAVTYNVIVQGNLRGGQYEAALKLIEEMDAKGFSPDSSTFALLLDLPDMKDHNSTIFKIFQKWVPTGDSGSIQLDPRLTRNLLDIPFHHHSQGPIKDMERLFVNLLLISCKIYSSIINMLWNLVSIKYQEKNIYRGYMVTQETAGANPLTISLNNFK